MKFSDSVDNPLARDLYLFPYALHRFGIFLRVSPRKFRSCAARHVSGAGSGINNISKAIKNFRFNDSPLFMLNNLEEVGRPVRLAGTEAGGAVVVPPIKVKDFTFTSLSDAV